jgi:hypothetical protein
VKGERDTATVLRAVSSIDCIDVLFGIDSGYEIAISQTPLNTIRHDVQHLQQRLWLFL